MLPNPALWETFAHARHDQLLGQEHVMTATNLAEAKAHLSELVDRAIAGEPQIIMRRGVPVAKIVAIERVRKPLDMEWLDSVTKDMKISEEVVIKMRNEARY
jgi:prevent-host-death family protein